MQACKSHGAQQRRQLHSGMRSISMGDLPSLNRPQLQPAQQVSSSRASAVAEQVAVKTRPQTPSSATSLNIRQNIRTLSSQDLDPDVGQQHLAYELIQGPLVRWTTRVPGQAPLTAVLVHGIMGSRRNLQSFARMIVQAFPTWQILLVDLRCHGDSAQLAHRPLGPHSVTAAARDVLQLVSQLKLFPTMLIGHSFGGKVVMSMVQQFGRASLPRPVQVWVLDSLPGEVRAGRLDGTGKPSTLISTLRSLQLPIQGRHVVIDALLAQGFDEGVARWAATNLRPARRSSHNGLPAHIAANASPGFEWSIDLEGIADMYRSYEETSLWPLLESPPQGLRVDFVKAESSTFKWGGEDERRLAALGHGVHLLRDAGHWVHTDNPQGLFDILAPSFVPRRYSNDGSASPSQN